VRGLTKRSKFAIGAVAAAAILQAVGLALSPAQALQSADAVSRVLAVINCTSADACSGGTSSGAGFDMVAVAGKNNAVDAGTIKPNGFGIAGLPYTAGGCSSGCTTTLHIDKYAPRESEPTMEDIGDSRLVAGKAYVRLDPAYADMIDEGASYVVFVSPEGPNQGLYVTQKTDQGFVVMENHGGHSSIPFGYRIVAKPHGVDAARLPTSVQPPMPARVRLQPGAAAMPHPAQ
jgi:hypothetical protein